MTPKESQKIKIINDFTDIKPTTTTDRANLFSSDNAYRSIIPSTGSEITSLEKVTPKTS